MRAYRVDIQAGGAGQIEASEVHILQGGAGRVRADRVSVQQGGIGIARAGEVSIENQSGAFLVLSRNARVTRDSNVFLLLARDVQGNVRPLVDWRAVLALGVGLSLPRFLTGRSRRG